MSSFSEMFKRLLAGKPQSRAARTVEIFGWAILLEGGLMLLAPHFVANVLSLQPLSEPASNFFRLAGLLVSGLGILYVVSGRLNSKEFVFASMLDRPLVPPVMGLLWYLGFIPGPLAIVFALSDGISFLWTFFTWKSESSSA